MQQVKEEIIVGYVVPGRWLRTRVLVGYQRRPWERLVVLGDLNVGSGIVTEDIFLPRVLAWLETVFKERTDVHDDRVLLPLFQTHVQRVCAKHAGDNFRVEEAYTLLVKACVGKRIVLCVMMGGDSRERSDERDEFECARFVQVRSKLPAITFDARAVAIPGIPTSDAIGLYTVSMCALDDGASEYLVDTLDNYFG